MKKVKLIKVCQFLYGLSKGGIMGCGIAMMCILAILSLPHLYGLTTSAKVDFTAITSDWHSYLWITIIVIYLIGSLVLIGNWIKNKANPSINKEANK